MLGPLGAISLWVLLPSLLVGQSDAQCSAAAPCVAGLGQGQPFVEPDQIDATLTQTISLAVDIADLQYGWLNLKRRVYNGKVTGPTWNIDRGQTLQVTLANRLSPLNNNEGPPNEMQKPNTTNLHTHGLHISANPPEDDVLMTISPEDQFVYQYNIHPEQPSGTYWYHAHVHGSTMFQVQSGMAGFIIVNDGRFSMPDELEEASCPHHCEADIQMIVQGILQFNNGFASFGQLQQNIGDDETFQQDDTLAAWLAQNVNLMTVNGLLEPVLKITENKMYRFRILNSAGFDTIEVFISRKGTNESTDACEIREIAYDGVYLDRPRRLHQGQSFLAPGNRVDWLVRCDRTGQYELRSYADPVNEMSIGANTRWSGLLVTLDVQFSYYRRNEVAQQLEIVNRNADNQMERQYGGWGRGGRGRGSYGGYGSDRGGRYGSNGGWGYGSSRGGRYGSNGGWGYGGNHGYGGWGYGGYHGYGGWGYGGEPDFDFDLPERPDFVGDLTGIPEEDITQRFVMEFGTTFLLNREHWLAADYYRYVMTVGEMQEWHIVNTDNEESHPFHMHVNHFQVISYNQYTGGFNIGFSENPGLYNQDDNQLCHYQRNATVVQENVPDDALRLLGHDDRYDEDAGNTLGYARVGEWRDTLMIPPLSNITIRFIPERYTCPVIIHCHLLEHEDLGMMIVNNIVAEGEPLDANTRSGDAYPGTCRECDRYPFNNPKRLCDDKKKSLLPFLEEEAVADEQ